MVKYLVLTAASLAVSMSALGGGQQRGLSVITTKIELTADYAADSKATHNAARARSVSANDMEANSAFDRMGNINDIRAGKKYRLSVVVKHDGPQTIRAVTLEYPLGYSFGRTPPEFITFKYAHRINPGETRTISHSFISSKRVVLGSGEQATIKKIVYVDGSVWRQN